VERELLTDFLEEQLESASVVERELPMDFQALPSAPASALG
jgi:hypothetical protein